MELIRPNWQVYPTGEYPLGVDDLRDWARGSRVLRGRV